MFTASLAAGSADARIRFRLEDAGRILDALTAIPDALRFVSYLRSAGGLDEHFAAYQAAFGDTEKVELETLEQAQKEASDRTVLEYAQLLAGRRDALRAVRDDAGGIELTTIHRAKGRQWPEVHLFACEEQQLPHRRALEVDAEQRAAGESLEAERRLFAYFALTRARERLSLHMTDSAPSRSRPTRRRLLARTESRCRSSAARLNATGACRRGPVTVRSPLCCTKHCESDSPTRCETRRAARPRWRPPRRRSTTGSSGPTPHPREQPSTNYSPRSKRSATQSALPCWPQPASQRTRRQSRN